ncbi:LuxR C-terminal-related transcriptional regulator [Streptomyces sp. NPDC021093]|uniref:LuxR C-terminal-related transcriptional regulator n=1 Tax=Streptomyces sp. NPDC021093 TaxID=3365112 RepID=UPI003798E71A
MDTLVNERTAVDARSVELTSAELACYRYIAQQGLVRGEDLLSDGHDDISVPAVNQLIDSGLVRRVGADCLAVVDPASVSDRLLEKRKEQVQNAQLDLLWMRGQLAELGLIYEAQQHSFQGPQWERIESPEEVTRALERHANECRQEVLSARPGRPGPDSELLDVRHRYQALLKRGVRMRALYQYATRFHPPTAQFTEGTAGEEAEVRTVSGDLARFTVFDREVLFVPLQSVPGGALVVRNSDLIASAVDMFHALWSTAEPINAPRERTFTQRVVNQTKRSILQHLIDGADDRTTARALGISVRTCQRHVSEIMQQLGASSRLQLGFLLREHGGLGA